MSEMFHHAEQYDLVRVSNNSNEPNSIQQTENKFLPEKGAFYEAEGFFYVQDTADELRPAISQHQNNQRRHQYKELGIFDDLYLDIPSPPFQSCGDDTRKVLIIEPQNTQLMEIQKKQSHDVFPSSSFEILRKYRSQRLQIDGENASSKKIASHARSQNHALSTEVIIKLSAEKFIQSMSQSSNELSVLSHPYPIALLTRNKEDLEGFQLVQNLLLCAEKVADMQYERAIKFMKECDRLSSPTGNPIQRLVFYFSKALFQKIARETGRIAPKELEYIDPLEHVKYPSKTMVAFNKDFPLAQIAQLVGTQAILDNLEKSRKLHVIDLEIRTGAQWIILMQALADQSKYPINHLKITAMAAKSKSIMEDTGRQLSNFAQSLNLKLTFKSLMVENILDLHRDDFDIDGDEAVAVYAAYTLMGMIGTVDRLDHLMRVIKSVNPCVMVVVELEANCNSPSFIRRFVESLFFFGAFFDSLAECFENDETCRRDAESTWFSSSIRNVLAADGVERKIRHVNLNVWRAFFARFGLVEIELSTLSMDQANLALKSFSSCGSSFTLCNDGECLTVGWKGTPLCSISAWKFQ